MTAVERILEYVNKKEVEASWTEPIPPVNWPLKSGIEGKNVRYKYRSDLDQVIKGIDFKISIEIRLGPHEKIGIVGRTGSGKSTLTLGLLRMLELQVDE